MSKKAIIITIITLIIIAGVIWYVVKGKELLLSTEQKRKALNDFAATDTIPTQAFNQMSADEINTAYTYVFDYYKKGRTPGTEIVAKINLISGRYNIFT